jgi:hypothetical protein
LEATVYSGTGGFELGNVSSQIQVRLRSSTIEKINTILSSISGTRIGDFDEIVDDGSSWKLVLYEKGDSVIYNIPNPTLKTRKRNLGRIVELGNLFSEVTDLKEFRENFY